MEWPELEGFKHLLETQLQHMAQPLRRRDEIAIENAPDTVDRCQQAAERELAIRHIESNFSRIQDIRLALERIDDGSYGTCLRCDQAISPRRLNAVPWAAYCIRCQEIADKEKVDRMQETFDPVYRRDVA